MIDWSHEIKKERARQISQKGYSVEHDDSHIAGEIADHAAAYATTDVDMFKELYPYGNLEKSIKTKDQDRKVQLVKAGALILAELERLERLES